MQETSEAFAELIHFILTTEKTSGKTIDAVSRKMGISADKLRSRIRTDHQRTNFTLDEIKKLIEAMADVRVIDFFLENTPYFAAQRNLSSAGGADRDEPSIVRESLRNSADEAVIEVTDILKVVVSSLKDGKLCHNDKDKIAKEIDEAERVLATLRSYIT